MQKCETENLLHFDPEIEMTCRKYRKERRKAMSEDLGNDNGQRLQNVEQGNNEINIALVELVVPQFNRFSSSIVRP